MSIHPEQRSVFSSIAAVERDTGLSKDTLRAWERRYGFPNPRRDANGERAYSSVQLEKLRALRRLIDLGHRPGKLIGLPIDQLQSLIRPDCADSSWRGAPAQTVPADLREFHELVVSHKIPELRDALSESAQRLGLEEFVDRVVTPLGCLIGESWARGEMAIFEEHLYSEVMQGVLRNFISGAVRVNDSPRILLTTIPNEAHGLGILVAEAFLTLEGCDCRSLGTQTPVPDIIRAAAVQEADVVALSFSACSSSGGATDALISIRQALPGQVEVWAGGNCSVLARRAPRGVAVISCLAEIRPRLQDWRRIRTG